MIFFSGRIFCSQPSFSGEPQIDDANFFISLEIVLAESRSVIGVLNFVASTIFL